MSEPVENVDSRVHSEKAIATLEKLLGFAKDGTLCVLVVGSVYEEQGNFRAERFLGADAKYQLLSEFLVRGMVQHLSEDCASLPKAYAEKE